MTHPIGTMVAFYWRPADEWLIGQVVDHLTFNGKVRHGVRVDGRTYDVWPDMAIAPAYDSRMGTI